MLTLPQLNRHLDDVHAPGSQTDHVEHSQHFQVTRKHWKKPSKGLTCAHASCNHFVERGGTNCAQCGNIYCQRHSAYRKKLDRDAKPNPDKGIWSRVCLDCFEGDEWRKEGTLRDVGGVFFESRKARIHDLELLVHRLEKRMKKLIYGLSKIDQENEGFKRLFAVQEKAKFEQQVVTWEDDVNIEKCRICGLRYTYFNRKHHCRVCGLTVCGDLDRECSREVTVQILAEKLGIASTSSSLIRLCEDCRHTTFGRRNFKHDVQSRTPNVIKMWQNLKHKSQQIDLLWPRFQGLAEKLAQGNTNLAVLNESKQVRTQLYTAFTQFDGIQKRLQDANTETPAEDELRNRMAIWARDYLQHIMRPLQSLPQALHSEEKPTMRKDKAMELQNQLVVLEEQRFMVQNMAESAKKRRHFDELVPLEQSLSELNLEIESLRSKLGSLAPS